MPERSLGALIRDFDALSESKRREAAAIARRMCQDSRLSIQLITLALPDEDTMAHLSAIELLREPVMNATSFMRSSLKRILRPSLARDLRGAIVSALRRESYDSDARYVASTIAWRLGGILVPDLIAILESGRDYPAHVAHILGDLGDAAKPAYAALLRLLMDEEQAFSNRSAAAYAVTRVATACGMSVPHELIHALRIDAIRFEVEWCLQQFMLAEDRAVRSTAANVLAAQGLEPRRPDPWPPLYGRGWLDVTPPPRGHHSKTSRFEAAVDDRVNVQSLIQALDHGEAELRAQAADALNGFRLGTDPQGRAAASALIKALDDPRWIVFNAAASTLRWQPLYVKEGIPRRHQRRVASALLGGGGLS